MKNLCGEVTDYIGNQYPSYSTAPKDSCGIIPVFDTKPDLPINDGYEWAQANLTKYDVNIDYKEVWIATFTFTATKYETRLDAYWKLRKNKSGNISDAMTYGMFVLWGQPNQYKVYFKQPDAYFQTVPGQKYTVTIEFCPWWDRFDGKKKHTGHYPVIEIYPYAW